MKSVLSNDNNDNVKPYPKLMRHKAERIIVFFHKPNCGMVVYSDTGRDKKIGHYSDMWTEVNAPDYWENYSGVVSLSND